VFRKGTVKGMGNAARDAGMGADRYHNASLFPQDPFFTRAGKTGARGSRTGQG
jgi:hypothetical protein